MNINYHVHTPLCNHAVGSMSEFIHQAISLGLVEICFLDHLTLNPADRGLTMAPAEVPLYFHTVRSLAHRYRDSISIKVGLEIDFHPDAIGCITALLENFDFDVIGGSVHYPGGTDIVTRNSDWRHGRGDTDRVYAAYFETVNRMLDADFIHLICHFDLPKKYGRLPHTSFEMEIDRLLRRIKAEGIALEINTSGYDHAAKEAYPSAELLRKCHVLGIPITLGSDAHSPDQLINHYPQAKDQLRAAGYTHLATFTRRRMGNIPLNPSPLTGIP